MHRQTLRVQIYDEADCASFCAIHKQKIETLCRSFVERKKNNAKLKEKRAARLFPLRNAHCHTVELGVRRHRHFLCGRQSASVFQRAAHTETDTRL